MQDKGWKDSKAKVKPIIRISTSVLMTTLVSCSYLQNAIPTMVHGTHIPLSSNTPVTSSETPQPLSTSSTMTSLPSTDTLQPSSTPSVTPIPLAANGPWGVVQTDKGIWAFNADGEGLRQLTQEQIRGNLAISPSGGKIAYLADNNSYNPNSENVSLRLISLPDGTIQTISDVMPAIVSLVVPTPGSSSGSPTPDLEVTSGQIYSSLDSGDWSLDGQRLAFTSAHDGFFTNVYVYVSTPVQN